MRLLDVRIYISFHTPYKRLRNESDMANREFRGINFNEVLFD